MFPSVFQRGDLDIAGQFADEGSSGKELPPSAAGVAEDCRPDGRFAAWLIADLVQITHHFVLPRPETLTEATLVAFAKEQSRFCAKRCDRLA